MNTLGQLQSLISDNKKVKDLKVRQIEDDFGNERFLLTANEYWSELFGVCYLNEWHITVKDGKVGYMDIVEKPKYDSNGNLIPAKYGFKETEPSIKSAVNFFINNAKKYA